jgi:hypothetical protein
MPQKKRYMRCITKAKGADALRCRRPCETVKTLTQRFLSHSAPDLRVTRAARYRSAGMRSYNAYLHGLSSSCVTTPALPVAGDTRLPRHWTIVHDGRQPMMGASWQAFGSAHGWPPSVCPVGAKASDPTSEALLSAASFCMHMLEKMPSAAG